MFKFIYKNTYTSFTLTVIFFLICFQITFMEGLSSNAIAKFFGNKDNYENFSELVEKSSPAVVNISTVKNSKGSGRVFRHFSKNPFGDEFFNDFFEKFFGDEQEREFKQKSLGSGFIIDENGYIVTNNHVVEDADDIKVKLKSGEEYEAKIIGRDSNTDIALIKVQTSNKLPVLELGNSDELKVGEWVFAIGSPFGLEHTVTAGIVSAKGRVIGSGPYDDFIQTDASINPGNSGGPLINLDGKVIGINTAIVAGGQGIGFAIPVNLAKGIINQLKENGEVTRGWLGVSIQDLNPDIAEYYGIKGKKGAVVTEVFPSDPADNAGIKPRDIIMEVNGEKIESGRDLSAKIAKITVGANVTVKLLREGKEKTFNVKIAKREDQRDSLNEDNSKSSSDSIGIEVANLTPEISRRFNIKEGKGIIVVHVYPRTKGEQAGIQTGDIIKEVNRQEINSIEDYKNILKKVKDGSIVEMLIKRGYNFLIIKLK
ncbi:MAG: DegQ family serine endoprotease [Desulfobacterales bacterium]|nr:DegQ family serine endoprotease [Desulfobacterales bacterium]